MADNNGQGGRAARLSGGTIATLVGAAVLVIFMVQNTTVHSVHFLFWTFAWATWLLVIVSAVFGAVLWIGLGILRRHRRRRERRD